MVISEARADLLVVPLRVVFEDRDRSEIVTLVNTSDKEHTYRLEWLEKKMSINGKYQDYTREAGEITASDLIKFSPRQITLGPKETQTVRLAVRRPEGLKPGEYRSHLMFKQLADIADEMNTKDVGVKLYVNLSISIPVIVRVGQNNTTAKFSSIKYGQQTHDGKTQNGFHVEIERTGNYSTYGSVHFYDAKDIERLFPIATLSNVSIFPEMPKRIMFVPILEKVAKVPNNLVAVYEGMDEFKGTVFSEMSATAP